VNMSPEQVQKELEPLAAKLGTTVEHIWDVLKRQAVIDGLSSLCTVLICGAVALAAVVVYRFYAASLKAKPKEPDRWQDPLPFVLLACIAVAGSNIYWILTDFLNPEFYAYRQLPFVR
jgi:hypothetical protein